MSSCQAAEGWVSEKSAEGWPGGILRERWDRAGVPRVDTVPKEKFERIGETGAFCTSEEEKKEIFYFFDALARIIHDSSSRNR